MSKYYNFLIGTNLPEFSMPNEEGLSISNNELFDAQSTSIFIENNFLSKEKLLYLIKQNQRHNNKKYKLVSLLKFDLDINMETFITET